MKKVLLILCSIFFLLGATGIAVAAPYTWTDLKDWKPDVKVPPTKTYTHDIKDDGFNSYLMGGDDFIYDYTLTVRLYDDDDRRWELALINQPGVIGDGLYNFDYTNQDFGWSLGGWAQLSLFGTLTVSVRSWCGDFYLDYSKLSVFGDDGGTPSDIGTVPVPEPASMLLFGTGLIGLAGTFRKKLLKN